MAMCAHAVTTADGLVLVLDPSVTDVGSCQYAVLTGDEAGFGSLFAMSPSDALVISGSVILLWAIAWGFRQVIQTIGKDHEIY
jgi:hypothetical protein